MKLIEDWKHVLRKAWTIKWSIAAGALGALELVIPKIPNEILPAGSVPHGTMLMVAVLLNTFVIPAVRVLAQEEKNEKPADDKVAQ